MTFYRCLSAARRRLRYAFWWLVVRLAGVGLFRHIGSQVKFNGWPRVENFGSDIKLGNDSMIGVGCYFLATPSGSIDIGNRVLINDYCYITSNFGIEIEDDVQIAEFTSIRDYDHGFSDLNSPISHQALKGSKIRIGRGSWVGRGVMITQGVNIGVGCVIGANSVVTRDIPDYSVAVGAPAKVIKNRAGGE